MSLLLWSIFTEKTIIAIPLYSKFSNGENKEILTWRNTWLKRTKSYIDNYPNPQNFNQPLSAKEILDELEIFKDDYYRALSIPNDEDLELCFKRQPDSYFVNNYFDVGLKAWQTYYGNTTCF